MPGRAVALLFCFVAIVTLLPVAAAERASRAPSRSSAKTQAKRPPAPRPANRGRARSIDLVWHVETLAGEVLESNRPDDAVNPASVTKAATTLWALHKLTPDHRFETQFLTTGAVDQSGTLLGDLIVSGGRDPDFQPENAFIVAAELNRRGVKAIKGALIVTPEFWIGYEGGSEGVNPDPTRRGLMMAQRLRQALDPKRWTYQIRHAWRETAPRHGLEINKPPRVAVLGTIQTSATPISGKLLLTHRSRPLREILHSFNAWSNNDMERVAQSIGSPADLAAFLRDRWGLPADALQFETTSGLGTNRITPRQMVTLMRDLKSSSERFNLSLDDLLGAAGCVPGTVSNFYARAATTAPGSIIGKTGTLISTDGGISVFAGIASTARGALVFSVAAPRSGGRIKKARWFEQDWVLKLADRYGGLVPVSCQAPLTPPDQGAEVELATDALVTSQATTATHLN